MRLARGRWFATFVVVIAAAACRKGSLMEDAGGTLPTGVAGQPGSDGAVGDGTVGDGVVGDGAGRSGDGPLKPGDPFVCAEASTPCIAGSSYCYSFNKGPTPRGAPSCQPLCPAGDCSCFCDNPDGCDFAPADGDCEADWCNCSTAFDSAGRALPGGVAVGCTYASTTPGSCYVAVAAARACSGITYTVYCTGATTTPPPSCTPLPDDAAAPACRTTESHYYCCPA